MKDSLKGRSTRQGVRINFYDGDELIKQFDSRREYFVYFEKTNIRIYNKMYVI